MRTSLLWDELYSGQTELRSCHKFKYGHCGTQGAIATAEQIVTVSALHAWDISSEEKSMGLHSLLANRADSVYGILNGIDTEEWDPEADEFISSRYL